MAARPLVPPGGMAHHLMLVAFFTIVLPPLRTILLFLARLRTSRRGVLVRFTIAIPRGGAFCGRRPIAHLARMRRRRPIEWPARGRIARNAWLARPCHANVPGRPFIPRARVRGRSLTRVPTRAVIAIVAMANIRRSVLTIVVTPPFALAIPGTITVIAAPVPIELEDNDRNADLHAISRDQDAPASVLVLKEGASDSATPLLRRHVAP